MVQIGTVGLPTCKRKAKGIPCAFLMNDLPIACVTYPSNTQDRLEYVFVDKRYCKANDSDRMPSFNFQLSMNDVDKTQAVRVRRLGTTDMAYMIQYRMPQTLTETTIMLMYSHHMSEAVCLYDANGI